MSINAIDQELSLNNFNGQLTAFDWQAGSQPSGYLAGTLGDMGRGLFQLEAVEGKLAFSPGSWMPSCGARHTKGSSTSSWPSTPSSRSSP